MANMKPLVGAPYIRGEIGKARNTEALFKLVIGTLFIVMPLAFIACQLLQIEAEIAFVGVWLITTALAIYAEYHIKPQVKVNAFQLFSLLIVLIGVPGVLFLRPGLLGLGQILAYVFILAMRLVVVFIIVPRCMTRSKTPAIEHILRWLIVGAGIISFATNAYYLMKGVTIFNSGRGAFETWLHPNLCAQFASILVYTTFMDPKLKMWARVLLVGGGAYTLLLTQSRSALVATILALLLLFLLNLIENPKKYSVRGFVGFIGSLIMIGLFGSAFREVPVVKNIERRTFGVDDPTAGRLDIFSRILEVWQNSQLFGYGFRSGGADNLYITLLLQTGIVGVFFYLALFFVIIYKGLEHFRFSQGPNRLLGKFILVASLSMFLRSFAETTSYLQLTDIMSNAYCIAGALAFLTPVKKRNLSKMVPTLRPLKTVDTPIE